jgi:hypothetical protein
MVSLITSFISFRDEPNKMREDDISDVLEQFILMAIMFIQQDGLQSMFKILLPFRLYDVLAEAEEVNIELPNEIDWEADEGLCKVHKAAMQSFYVFNTFDSGISHLLVCVYYAHSYAVDCYNLSAEINGGVFGLGG